MRSDKRHIASRLQVVLTHLLKWRYQGIRSGNSWRLTILEQRRSIMDLLDESPSLRPTLPAAISKYYDLAAGHAAVETKLPESTFPSTCEWTTEQVLDPTFLPDAD